MWQTQASQWHNKSWKGRFHVFRNSASLLHWSNFSCYVLVRSGPSSGIQQLGHWSKLFRNTWKRPFTTYNTWITVFSPRYWLLRVSDFKKNDQWHSHTFSLTSFNEWNCTCSTEATWQEHGFPLKTMASSTYTHFCHEWASLAPAFITVRMVTWYQSFFSPYWDTWRV